MIYEKRQKSGWGVIKRLKSHRLQYYVDEKSVYITGVILLIVKITITALGTY